MSILTKIFGIALVVVLLFSGIYFFYSQNQMKKLNTENGEQKVSLAIQNSTIADIKNRFDKINGLNRRYNTNLNNLRIQDSKLRNELSVLTLNSVKDPRGTELKINQHQNKIFNDISTIDSQNIIEKK